MPRKPPVASVIHDLVTAHGIDRATEIAEALTGRTGRLALRVPAEKDRAYRAAAKAAGLSVSRWIERACDGMLKRDGR